MHHSFATGLIFIFILIGSGTETVASQCESDVETGLGIELVSRPKQSQSSTSRLAADCEPELHQVDYSEEDFPLTHDDSMLTNSDTSAARPWVKLSDVFPLFTGDTSLGGVPPISEDVKPYGVIYFVDYDAFRGIADGGWENNGIRTGFNFATRLGPVSDLTGVGFQIGSSIGAYDWAGTDYRLQNSGRVQSQGFLTYGLYRKPTEDSRITAGLVQDWMFNDTYGVFGQSPTLSQLRGQVGYATSASNEFGVWGTAHVLSSTRNVPNFGPTKWQSVNQISGYWHHKWSAGGPDTWLSVGVPSYDRLSGGGTLGDYVVTATSSCPLSDVVSIVSSVTYLHQSGAPSEESSNDEAWNFIVGISIYPGRNARSTTVAGQRWMPLLPVANNGNFLVDTSNHY